VHPDRFPYLPSPLPVLDFDGEFQSWGITPLRPLGGCASLPSGLACLSDDTTSDRERFTIRSQARRATQSELDSRTLTRLWVRASNALTALLGLSGELSPLTRLERVTVRQAATPTTVQTRDVAGRSRVCVWRPDASRERYGTNPNAPVDLETR
jgi:hypothetical protein